MRIRGNSLNSFYSSQSLRHGVALAPLFFLLHGCGTLPPDLGDLGQSPSPSAAVIQHAGQTRPRAVVVLMPMSGPSADASRRIIRELDAAATRLNLALVVDPAATGTFRLQGHLLASRDNADVVLSYVWSVTDGGGQRRQQVTGSETVANGGSNPDTWSAVSGSVIRTMSEKAMQAVIAAGGVDAANVPGNPELTSGAQPPTRGMSFRQN